MTYDGRYPEPPYDKGDDATVALAVELAERDEVIAKMDALLARAADRLNISPRGEDMDLGSEITQFRQARQATS